MQFFAFHLESFSGFQRERKAKRFLVTKMSVKAGQAHATPPASPCKDNAIISKQQTLSAEMTLNLQEGLCKFKVGEGSTSDWSIDVNQ
ncbi:MAG: hypothetical protein IJV05_04045 [Muribaculaceae bacterium]|nr:hypothetical protein [Muribaculaceae bacterium]